MRRGFTLIEMLVVIGIIAILVAAGITGYDAAIKKAQNAKLVELVHEVQTALSVVYQRDGGTWPSKILAACVGDSPRVDAEVGAVLAKRGVMSFSYRKEENKKDATTRYVLTDVNKFGLVTPWAEEVIKKNLKNGRVSLTTKVPTGGTVEDHLLRFAIDDDGDGIVKLSEAPSGVRASVCVWSAGRDGRFGTKDDVKSWAEGQVVR